MRGPSSYLGTLENGERLRKFYLAFLNRAGSKVEECKKRAFAALERKSPPSQTTGGAPSST